MYVMVTGRRESSAPAAAQPLRRRAAAPDEADGGRVAVRFMDGYLLRYPSWWVRCDMGLPGLLDSGVGHALDDVPLGEEVDASMGRMETTEPAMTMSHWVVNWPCRVARPRGRVMSSGERMTTSGHRKLFQLPMKAKTASVASAGRMSGRMIVPEDPQVAGAVDRGGLVELARHRFIGLAQQEDPEGATRTTAAARRGRCSAGPSVFISMNSGTMSTCSGIIRVAR